MYNDIMNAYAEYCRYQQLQVFLDELARKYAGDVY